jgi:hypothetical protein
VSGRIEIPPQGPALRSDRDAVTLIGDAIGGQATVVLVPIERFDNDFFDLKTRVAGEFFQKFVNYGMRLVIVGDISRHTERSESLRDFVYEANRGDRIWFSPTQVEAVKRMEAELVT